MTVGLERDWKSEPYIGLYEVFQNQVLKPNNAMPVFDEHGLVSARNVTRRAAARALARDKSRLPPQLFEETVFEFNGFWKPASIKCKWTEGGKAVVGPGG